MNLAVAGSGKEHLLIALGAYFDGSSDTGSWAKGNLMSLAGFAADDSLWADFEKSWEAILNDDRERPIAPYFHAKEAVNGSGIFSWRNKWSRKQIDFLMTDILRYMQTLDKQRFQQFACTVDLQAYRKVKNEGLVKRDAMGICNDHCPFTVLGWYVNDYPQKIIHSAHFFFDKNEPFEDDFRACWRRQTENILDHQGMKESWSIIKTVTSADMKDEPALQAADLLAWASNRTYGPGGKEKPYGSLEWMMKQIIPSTSIFWDEGKFRRHFKAGELTEGL